MKDRHSLFFNTSLIYFVVIACFVALRILTSVVDVGILGSNFFSLLIQVGFMFLIPFIMYKSIYKKTSKQVFKDFHVKKINCKAILIAIGIGIVVYFLNLAVASFFNVFIVSTGYDPSFGMSSAGGGEYTLVQFLGDLILTALLPGICEEFCHRGLLVNGYKQIGIKKTIFLVGLLFGLMHLNVEQFFYATVIGMFLTFLVYLTDSIIPSIIIHFLNNAIGLYITFAEYNNLPFGNLSNSLADALSGNPLTVFMLIIFVVVLMLGLLIFLTYMLLKQTRVKDFQKLAKRAIDASQRESLLKSFDIDVNELDGEKTTEPQEPKVSIGPQFIKNGKQNVMLDISFSENDLMSNVVKKTTVKDRAFLIGTLVLGVIITISTLIWGII